jgi:putative multiple sugar transport system ATP-binding protein
VVDDHVNFTVHKGEIVGFSGLQGAGRTELAMSIFGHSYGTGITGTLILNGREVSLKTERQAIEAGLAYVTEDRKGNGLVLEQTIAKNTTMARLEKVCRRGIVDVDQENAVAEEYKDKLKTKTPSVQQAVGNLSGGNQQKVLLAKWMFADPDVLILDEPTRGIDVGAKYEIYCIMNDLVAQGKSVIMISSEMPELLGMCDRIYVMNEGRMVAEMPAAEASQEKIMAAILKSDKN